MDAGEAEGKILQNIKSDACIEKEREEKFFKLLIESDSPKDAEEARKQAINIVEKDKEYFTCSGDEVPSDIFKLLLRFQRPSSIGHSMPADKKEELFAKFGITSYNTANEEEEDFPLEYEDLKIITDEYDGDVVLGNKKSLDIVWVADFNNCESLLSGVRDLLIILGLDTLLNEKKDMCLILQYTRSKLVESLHVPRAFDGIGSPQFQVQSDCDAYHGITKPLENGYDGLPEAIHRGCKVKLEVFDVRRIE